MEVIRPALNGISLIILEKLVWAVKEQKALEIIQPNPKTLLNKIEAHQTKNILEDV